MPTPALQATCTHIYRYAKKNIKVFEVNINDTRRAFTPKLKRGALLSCELPIGQDRSGPRVTRAGLHVCMPKPGLAGAMRGLPCALALALAIGLCSAHAHSQTHSAIYLLKKAA